MINIYKASAGSGKTFTLAREYIKLLLGHKKEDGSYCLNRGKRNTHRSVLAITFTNKATEEMKNRIIHELAVIAGLEKGWSKESPYATELCNSFSCSGKELKNAASIALHDLLYDFNFFGVSTIDSFFQTILRAFAREAEVSGNYELELDDRAIIAMSVDKLLQDLNHGEQTKRTSMLINWLSNYMTALIEDGRTFNIFNRTSYIHRDLISFIADITDDVYRENEKELLTYLSDETKFNEFKNRIFRMSREITDSTVQACRKAILEIDNLDGKDIVSSNIYKPISKWAQNGYDSKPLSATVLKSCDDIDNAYVKKGKTSPLRPDFDPVIHNALEAMKFSSENVRTLRIISANLYQLGLLSTIATYLDRYRRENSTILLSDTNALISKIIGNEDTPFLYERVGTWYRHYLIDEFQDTSHSQWSNLRPLIKESLAYDHDNLVIGDEKQCIYRFRNSDPSLLHNLHNESITQGRVKISGDTISENTNWRSSADVIRFNNEFFSSLVKNLGFEDIYSNVVQQVSPKHTEHHGHVKVSVYQGTKKEEWTEEALANLTIQLRRQLSSGYRPGEIAILVRRWDEGNMIIKHLESVKLTDPDFPPFRIVSDSSLMLGNSPSVSLIISRLRLISATDFTPDSRKKTRREVAALINRFESLRSHGASPSCALVDALNPGTDSSNLNPTGPGHRSTASEATISDFSIDLISLVENIISEFVPIENLHGENLYITAFQDLVTEYVNRGHGDIRSFLRWWDETGSKTSVAGASDDSALNILTIHKSKGLEYPCVHIPFAQMTTGNHSELAWFRLKEIPGIDGNVIPPMIPLRLSSAMDGTPFADRYTEVCNQNKLDTVNLLYVAFTRAVDELHIGLPSASGRSAGMSADIIDAIKLNHPGFETELTIGTPTKAVEKHKSDKTALTPSLLLDMKTYYTCPHREIWSNTKLEERYYNIENARDRGILLHDIMADIRIKADVQVSINNLRHARKAKELTEDDINEIHSIILSRVNDKRASKWFEGYSRVLIERPVITGSDKSYRPDRVVWTSDGAIDIIDFKSGVQPPARYRKQIRGYVDLLSSMGYKNVCGYLYYLDSGDIISV